MRGSCIMTQSKLELQGQTLPPTCHLWSIWLVESQSLQLGNPPHLKSGKVVGGSSGLKVSALHPEPIAGKEIPRRQQTKAMVENAPLHPS